MIAFAKPPGTSGIRSADELLAEFRATGAQPPFEELVRRYAAMVFSECYAVTKSRHEAEDAAQATFLTLAVQARTGDEIRHLGPWLQRVARRVALDQEKAKRRRKRREDNHHRVNGSTGLATPDKASLDQLELRHLINEELQQLPAKYRMPLILHYFGGLSREQMARELKCKPATLGVRLFRARDMLGKRLSKRGITLPAAALPIAIAMVVRESVEQHGVLAMAASAGQIASAASRVAMGLVPHAGTVSSGALALTDYATNTLVLRKVKAMIAAAAIGASALAAGGSQVVQKIQDGTLSLQSLFDLSGYFRSLNTPSLPQLHVDASQTLDAQNPNPAGWPAGLGLAGEGSLQWTVVSAQSGRAAYDTAPRTTNAASPTPAPFTQSNTSAPRPATPRTTPEAAPVLASAAAKPESAATPAVAAPSRAAESSERPASDGLEIPLFASIDFSASGSGLLGPFARAGGGGGGGGGWGTSGNLSGLTSLGGAFVVKPVPPLPTPNNHVGGIASASTTAAPWASGYSAGSSSPQSSQISSQGNILRGWGTPTVAGTMDMSGVVIADGYEQPRTLSFSAVSEVINSIPNPPTGVNGWYAQRCGKLTLPALRLSAGESTVTWGDTVDATGRLDLVNSLQLAVHNTNTAGNLEISLLAADRSEVPTLPRGYQALTIWSLSPDEGLSYTGFDMDARYAIPGSDLAGPLSGLGVFYFDGNLWRSVTSKIDTSTRLISADGIPATAFLALLTAQGRTDVSLSALGLTEALTPSTDLLAPTGLNPITLTQTMYAYQPMAYSEAVHLYNPGLSSSLPPAGSAVPEPTSLVWLIATFPLLGRRRRSSRKAL